MQPSTSTSRRPKLLVVDDDPDNRVLIIRQLHGLNLDITEAQDGIAALRSLELQNQDAILCDLQMPNMNGLELLLNLRNTGKKIPFVLLTGRADEKTIQQAADLRCYDFLLKPWHKLELEKSVLGALELGAEINHWKQHSDQSNYLDKILASTEKASRLRLEARLKTFGNKGE